MIFRHIENKLSIYYTKMHYSKSKLKYTFWCQDHVYMIENILKNTTKLVSQFLEFKCIFYDVYKLGLCCCGTRDEHVRQSIPLG